MRISVNRPAGWLLVALWWRWLFAAALVILGLAALFSTLANVLALGPRNLLNDWVGDGKAHDVAQVRNVVAILDLASRVAPFDRELIRDSIRARLVWRASAPVAENDAQLLTQLSAKLQRTLARSPLSAHLWIDISIVDFLRSRDASATSALRTALALSGNDDYVRKRVVALMFFTWDKWGQADRDYGLRLARDLLANKLEQREVIDAALRAGRLALIKDSLKGNRELINYVMQRASKLAR